MKRFAIVLATFLPIVMLSIPFTSCHAEEIFQTKYTTVHYETAKDMTDFVWRLGGKRYNLAEETALVSNRIDRIVERVKALLDMRPRNFHIDIYLRKGGLEYGKIAHYEYGTKAIYVSVDDVSDGVFAHELSHAIIDQYFVNAPPSKVQEILAQYVDQHLWNEY